MRQRKKNSNEKTTSENHVAHTHTIENKKEYFNENNGAMATAHSLHDINSGKSVSELVNERN